MAAKIRRWPVDVIVRGAAPEGCKAHRSRALRPIARRMSGLGYIITLTVRSRPVGDRKPRDGKETAPRESGSWNAGHRRVAAALFREGEFFDPRDLLQVKYEMLRQVRAEGKSVTDSAAAFGFSRPSFYNALAALERE